MDAVELEPIALTVTSARLLIRGYVVEYLAYFFHSVQITKLLREKKKIELPRGHSLVWRERKVGLDLLSVAFWALRAFQAV